MKPYWTSEDGAITVYHARWEDVLAAGLIPVREVALVHADPPYGNGDDVHRPGAVDRRPRKDTTGVKVGKARHYPPIAGNDRPFDPAPLLVIDRPLVTWGANHYASGDLVLVPYLGSGPDLPAARAMGLRVIACDVESWCLDTAIGRLGAITPERAAEPIGPLFGGTP